MGAEEVRRAEPPVNGISVLTKETPEGFPGAFQPVRTGRSVEKLIIYEQGGEFFPDTESAGSVTLDVPASRTVRNTGLLLTAFCCGCLFFCVLIIDKGTQAKAERSVVNIYQDNSGFIPGTLA